MLIALDRLALRVATATDNVHRMSLAFTPRAAIVAVLLGLAITARMSAFLVVFHVASLQVRSRAPQFVSNVVLRAPQMSH
jgi:hypothetical protein